MDSSADSSAKPEKRKRIEECKFYAVKVGMVPGIYRTYNECLQQVKGVKGALFKAFSTEVEAQNFVDYGPTVTANQKFYAVRNGRIPGIYTDWPTCEAQVRGFAKPRYKSFVSRLQAEAFLNGVDAPGDADPAAQAKTKRAKKSGPTTGNINEIEENCAAGSGPMPEGATDEFDSGLVLDSITGRVQYKTQEQKSASKMLPVAVAVGQPLRIYTDGSSLKNGTLGAQAGVGVYFGPKDSRNVSEALAGTRQTNQRAELTAIKRAVELSPRDRDIIIYTDSKYAISCCTEWFQNWRRNGWLTSEKKPVENKDLVEAVVGGIDQRFRIGASTRFEWVKGHAANAGNIAADELAVAGARNAVNASIG